MAQRVETHGLAADLPPPLRLAVAYAPTASRAAWIALLALDHRLARAVAGAEASEPLIGQLKLAWWRDRMREPASTWPLGEPLLAALAAFDRERAALEALVDGWEAMLGGDDGEDGCDTLVDARTRAVTALARLVDCNAEPQAIAAHVRRWTKPGAQAALVRLPRALRPLVILAHLPRRDDAGLLALARIVRLGMLGR